MRKHTPGPWYVEQSAAWGWAVRSNGAQYRTALGEMADVHVAFRLSKADAKAIAALPALLEATKDARHAFDCGSERCNTCHIAELKLEAAIKSAEGEE